MYIVYHRSLFFWITGAMLAGAIGAILVWGLPLGIDFKGGSLMQVDYQNERPALADIQKQVDTLSLGTVSVRAHGDNGIAIRARTMTPEEHIAVLSAVSSVAPATELSYTSVGPALGSQFTNKALWAIFAVMLVIVLYIA